MTTSRRRRWIGPAIVAGAIVTAVFAFQPRGEGTTGGGTPSAGPTAVARAQPPTSTPTPVPPEPGHEVYGYVPYWEMDHTIAEHLAKTKLTTLALFSVTHDRTGRIATNQNGYRRITSDLGRQLVREAHDRKTRVELVYSSFGATKNQRFYDDPAAQDRWIATLVDVVDEQGFDGVNVDVESLPGVDIEAYGSFVGRLREALRARDPKAQVSVATTGNAKGIAMAAVAARAGADRIFLMGYDYHYEGSQPGASSPLDDVDGSGSSLRNSLDAYAALGVPAEKTILGLPLYGQTWPVEGPELGAAKTANGHEWVPRLNLRVFDAAGFAPTLEPIESVEFYAVEKGDQWHAVYYDSPRSLTPKLALADERGLAGAGFWSIGFERGLPAYTDLIARFRAGKLDPSG